METQPSAHSTARTGTPGLDVFKIAGKSISGFLHSLKTGDQSQVRMPYTTLLEAQLALFLEYHPLVQTYQRGDMNPVFATAHHIFTPLGTLLKELTDNLAAPPYERLLGLGLVTAHGNNDAPFRETFARPETLWRQYRQRMDAQNPYIIVPGHTEEELRLILATFEDLYRDQFPDLHLHAGPNPSSVG